MRVDEKIVATRRKRLREVIENRYQGKQANLLADFHARTGNDLNQGELSGLLSGAKSFGEKKARSLELSLGLESMALDKESDCSSDTQLRINKQGPETRGAMSVSLAKIASLLEGKSEEELNNIVRGIELLINPAPKKPAVTYRQIIMSDEDFPELSGPRKQKKAG